MDFFNEKSPAVQSPSRPESRDIVGYQADLYPFDAFEFDDSNKVDFPTVRMKYPWRLIADYIGSSGDPWNYQGVVGTLPDGAYFSALRDITETAVALLDRVDDDLLPSEGVSGLNHGTAPYTISGTISYDLGQIPEYVSGGGYTIIVYAEAEGWNYLSGSGAAYGGLIEKSGDLLTIASQNLLPQPLPFLLLAGIATFRDLIVIPQNYTEEDILALVDGVDTFSWEDGSLSADRGFTLSPDGFYWYNGGQYIKLGTEAVFSGVDLKSGQWDGEITDGEITSSGTQGWAIASKGDVEFNDGEFRGELVLPGGESVEDAIADKSTTYAQTTTPTGSQVVEGDIWIDTGNDNNYHRYNGTTWVDVRDETIDKRANIYRQNTQPVLVGKLGDIWYDTDDNDFMYVHNGTSWVAEYSMKSKVFTAGSAGWAIYKNGDVEFNNGTFRGNLRAAGGNLGALEANLIKLNTTYTGTQGAIATAILNELSSASVPSYGSDSIVLFATESTVATSYTLESLYRSGTSTLVLKLTNGTTLSYSTGSTATGYDIYIKTLSYASVKTTLLVNGARILDSDSTRTSRMDIGDIYADYIASYGEVRALGGLSAKESSFSGPGLYYYKSSSVPDLVLNSDSLASGSQLNANKSIIIKNTNSSAYNISESIRYKSGLTTSNYASIYSSKQRAYPFMGQYNGYQTICFVPESSTKLRLYYMDSSATVSYTTIDPTSTTQLAISGYLL